MSVLLKPSLSLLILSLVFSAQVAPAQTKIRTVAGNGSPCAAVESPCGDRGRAARAQLYFPKAVAVDTHGILFIADSSDNRIRKIDSAGVISTVAGLGGPGFYGDGGPANAALLNQPWGLTIDHSGNIYIADTGNSRIRKVDGHGVISTVAGNGTSGFSGDGGAATAAGLNFPVGVAVDAGGNLYIADKDNRRVRKVNDKGVISTFAGNGKREASSGDGHPATDAVLNSLSGIALDRDGNLYLAETLAIRKVDARGMISTVVSGLNNPFALATNIFGNLFFTEPPSHRVLRRDRAGAITTIAGTGAAGYNGDAGIPTSAQLNNPEGLAADDAGNVYIADCKNNRIRCVWTFFNP